MPPGALIVFMDVSDIRDGMRRIDCQGEVFSVGEPRSVKVGSRDARVADAKLRDKTGEITLSLWDDQVDQVTDGSFVRLTGGYAKNYRGTLQVSSGQYGKLEVVEGEELPPPLKCPSCGFETNKGDWKFCPRDGEALS